MFRDLLMSTFYDISVYGLCFSIHHWIHVLGMKPVPALLPSVVRALLWQHSKFCSFPGDFPPGLGVVQSHLSRIFCVSGDCPWSCNMFCDLVHMRTEWAELGWSFSWFFLFIFIATGVGQTWVHIFPLSLNNHVILLLASLRFNSSSVHGWMDGWSDGWIDRWMFRWATWGVIWHSGKDFISEGTDFQREKKGIWQSSRSLTRTTSSQQNPSHDTFLKIQ